MTIEQLHDLLTAQPFRAFRIHLADGRYVDIQHPELLAHGGGRTFVVYTNDEHFEVVDLLLVTSLETIDGKPKRGRKRTSR